jgi:Glycosyl transferase family 2
MLKSNQKIPSVGVFITVWKRRYLKTQLASLINQTLKPDVIWVLQNENHINVKSLITRVKRDFPQIFLIHSQNNLKFFGRFNLATHIGTDYTFVIDDDVIPSKGWLERCLGISKRQNCVVACTGRIIKPYTFRPELVDPSEYPIYFIGDNYNKENHNLCDRDTVVDYGCNSYFFKTEWLKYFWSVWPCTFMSGEDIHLSASLKLTLNLDTIVPAQTCVSDTGNLNKYLSQDEVSSWRKPGFFDIREQVFKYMINEKKWAPVLW